MARQAGTPQLYNRDAERAVLGSCLLGRLDLVAKARAGLPPDAFYVARHATIWRTICSLADDGIPADGLMVDIRAKELGERWSDAEDRLYVLELAEQAPVAANPAHVSEVARWARLRRVWETGTRLAQQAASVAEVGADVGGRLEALLAQPQTQLADLSAPVVDEPGSWRPVDIEPILSGTWTTPEPAVGQRADGRAFLYAGKVHTAAGEAESGKSWFSVALGVAEMAAGR